MRSKINNWISNVSKFRQRVKFLELFKSNMLCGKTHSFRLALKCLGTFHHQDTMSKQFKWKVYKRSRLVLIWTRFPWFYSRLGQKGTWQLAETPRCTFVSHSCGWELTSKMLSSAGQQAVEDVERSFILGLSYGSRLLQKIFQQNVKDWPNEVEWEVTHHSKKFSLLRIKCNK